MQAKLTGRERVSRMFERRDQDRIPHHDSFWGETIARWKSEGLDGDGQAVLRLLDSDFQGLCWSSPVPFPGRREIVREDDRTQVIRDAWGATLRYWKGRSGTPEHFSFECDSRRVWENRFKPVMLANPVQIDLDRVEKAYAAGRQEGKWCYLAGLESFEAMRRLMGDEIMLVAMASEPEWVRDVSRTYTDLVLRDLEAAMARGVKPDGFWIYGDMAYNHGTLCSPAMYRDLVWPDHQRMAEWGHQRGMKVIFHTDGDVNGVVDLYLQAGFDCLQPLEAKAHMDVRQLAPRYGNRLALFGNIDVMVMGSNDRARIEHEVLTKLAAGMRGHGYAYHSDHSVPPTVSWSTYRFIIELVNDHGRYA
ncbi:MAG: hypothetical protein HYU36_17305 [Planctomycetes bacterium]|nr:hypothetical protein [Planctomycetota bacterium]